MLVLKVFTVILFLQHGVLSADGDEHDEDDISGDNVALLQTEINVSTGASREPSGNYVAEAWSWLTQHKRAEGHGSQHRRFIAISLLMTSVWPWAQARQEKTSGANSCKGSSQSASRPVQRLSRRVFSACCQPCYLSVLVLWLKHYWFQGSFFASEALIMFAGFTLEYEGRCHGPQDGMLQKCCNLIPERFTRLYPFYALYVLLYPPAIAWMGRLCNLFWESPSAETGQCHQTCSGLAWTFSVAFGCYILAPLFANCSREMAKDSVLLLFGVCTALVLLPRTLASTMYTRSKATRLATTSQTVSMGELTLTPESLLCGLVNFFFGMICARAWLAVKLGSLAPFVGTKSNHEQVDSSCQHTKESEHNQRPCSKREASPDQVLGHVELLQLLGPLRTESAVEY
mmetsp:Transcript_128376/g.233613  ORF Transcript_128376/g.233613 Transcript_128376/m.233613 type:complete len:401 (-) Transcript_128376:141-1343(-)